MDKKKYILDCRRRFILGISGIFSGFMMISPGSVRKTKSAIKKFIWNLESDILVSSKPSKHPFVNWKKCGKKIHLYKKQKEATQLIGTINQTGKTVLKNCNGKNTPNDIAELLQQRYKVTAEKAYVDSLIFLADLKTKGAIEL